MCVPEAGHDMAGGTEGASQLGRRNRLPQRVLYPDVQHGWLVGRAENRTIALHNAPLSFAGAIVCRNGFSILMSSMDGSYDALKKQKRSFMVPVTSFADPDLEPPVLSML